MLSSWTGIYPLASSAHLKACLAGYPLWVNPDYLDCFISLQGSPKFTGESVYDFIIHYKLVKKKKTHKKKTKQEKRNLRNLYSRTCCHLYFPQSSYSFCFTVCLVVYNLIKSHRNCKSIPIYVSLPPLMNDKVWTRACATIISDRPHPPRHLTIFLGY